MILCAGNGETFDFALPIGVGLVETAMNLTRLCLLDPPDFLLFVGTAGSYGDHGIFEIVESKTAANIETGFLWKKAYTPLDNVISAAGKGRNDTVVNSSNYITTDPEAAKLYLKLGIGIENMEFFSVLRIAQAFDIPAGGLFCVTNNCDENAHTDFLKNREEAMARLNACVSDRIKVLKR